MATDFMLGESLYRDVIAYSQMGEHRTATEVDRRTSEWIAEQLEAAGLETSFQPFAVRQFFVRETSLTVAGKQVECFPWWYPHMTGPQPIRARLAPLGAESARQRGNIALVKLSRDREITPANIRPYIEEIVQTSAGAGALAVVVITERASKEIFAFNTSEQANPWPVPVVTVGSRDEPALTAAAEQGAEASLLVDGRDEPQAEARNVIGKLNRGKDMIMVVTPQSGWFHCGCERGPGIALFLALARWVGQRQPQISYLFTSNPGHELLSLGLRNFLRELAPPPEQVIGCLHLGASIGTWSWDEDGLRQPTETGKYRLMCSSADLLPLLNKAFANMPGMKPAVGLQTPLGGFPLLVNAGYRGVGISVPYKFYHAPADGPEGTAPELLAPFAESLSQTLESFEGLAKR